jgi:hypothetical protein
MKEQRQKIKKERDIGSLEVEEHPLIEGNIYENWMDSNESPQNLQQQ